MFFRSPDLPQVSESGLNPGIRGQSLVLTQSRHPHSANLPPREIIAADIDSPISHWLTLRASGLCRPYP
jgi:hypothetical protein